MRKCPFFIVGTGRCGTQLLRNILNKNPEVKVVPETHFFPVLYEKFGTGPLSCEDFMKIVLNMYGSRGKQWIYAILKDTGKSLNLFEEEFRSYCSDSRERALRTYMELFYSFFYGENVLIGDKTPHYGAYAAEIKQIWPDAKFIHLVRDGVDVAYSMSGHPAFVKYINGKVSPKELDTIMFEGKNRYLPSDPVSMEQALTFWEELYFATKNALEKVDQRDVLTLRYEDLLYKPDDNIKQLAHFLGLDRNGSWIKKAAQLPRPFPERNQIRRFDRKVYHRYASLVKEGMGKAGYPVDLSLHRGIMGSIKELWRCRNYYIGKLNPLQWVNNLVKARRRKALRGT